MLFLAAAHLLHIYDTSHLSSLVRPYVAAVFVFTALFSPYLING